MRTLVLLLASIISLSLIGQEIVTDLNGFRLGQFREVPKNELKTILQQDKFEDGFEYEIYLLEQDTSAYMIFEYANYDLQTIWSIQLTGNKEGYDCSFKGLKLGMTTAEIEKKIGNPSSIEDAGPYGKRWEYDQTNYSLEISPAGLLAGIKIIDKSVDFYPKPDMNKIPSYNEFIKTLNSKNRKTVSELIAPSIEIYKNEKVYFFQHSWDKEVKNDKSGIFKLINETTEMLNKIDPNDSLQYEENMRLSMGQDPKHVVKFKVDGVNNEIVFKYIFGRYLIWEVKLN